MRLRKTNKRGEQYTTRGISTQNRTYTQAQKRVNKVIDAPYQDGRASLHAHAHDIGRIGSEEEEGEFEESSPGSIK